MANERTSSGWVDEMLAALGAVVEAKVDVERAQRIKDPHLPSKLYRYRTCNEYALQNLRSKTEWMTPPRFFNDPYDSAFGVAVDDWLPRFVDVDPPALLAALAERSGLTSEAVNSVLQSNDPPAALAALCPDFEGVSAEVLHGWSDLARNFLRREASAGMEMLSEALQAGLRVTCLSESSNSLLMWGHYGDQHKGLCVEYDFGALPSEHQKRAMLYPVIYQDKLFDATAYIPTKRQPFNNLFGAVACMHKATAWRYEREWRLIAPGTSDAPNGFNTWMPKPSRVLLGSRMAHEHAQAVRAIARELGIEVRKMYRVPGEFGMNNRADDGN